MMKRAAWALFFASAMAQAHDIDHPRRLLLEASPGTLDATFTFELAWDEADKVRRLFDRNRDGVLAPSEKAALTTYLERRAVGEFELRRGDELLESEPVSSELKGAEAGEPTLGIRVTRRWRLKPREKGLSIFDGGDATGHLPVHVHEKGVSVKLGAVKFGRSLDLPARQRVSLRIERNRERERAGSQTRP